MRLNAAVRQEITRNASKALLNRAIKLAKWQEELAVKCHHAAVDVKLRKAIEAVHELGAPNGWVKQEHYVMYNVGGQNVRLRSHLPQPVTYNYQAAWGALGKPIGFDKHEKLINEVREWQAADEQLTKDKSQAETTLKAMLKSVGSTETLFKVWPEGKKFYSSPPLTPQVKTGVPAVQMQALNEMLGLNA